MGSCWFLLPMDVRCGEKCYFAENRCEDRAEGKRDIGDSGKLLESVPGEMKLQGNLILCRKSA